jgi:hypothetical protein
MIVRKVGVWSAAKLYGAITAAFGVLVGLGFALVATVGGQLSPDGPHWMGPMFGVGGIIFFPLLYGVFGLCAGALSALFYNVFAGMVGGLSLDVE